jgi:hypothetical protein
MLDEEVGMPGVLRGLCEGGCGTGDCLVVTGTAAGTMWGDNGFDLFPLGISFLTWYQRWLDECIASLTLAPLIDRVSVGMTKGDAIENVGLPCSMEGKATFRFEHMPATFHVDSRDVVVKVERWPSIQLDELSIPDWRS